MIAAHNLDLLYCGVNSIRPSYGTTANISVGITLVIGLRNAIEELLKGLGNLYQIWHYLSFKYSY